MSAERENGRQSPQIAVRYFLNNPGKLELLLDTERNSGLISDAKKRFGAYSPDETTELAGILINTIGSDAIEDIDRREGALQLLQAVPFSEKVKPETLLEMYTGVLNKRGESSDPLGGVYSLIEAGTVLLPRFPLTPESQSALNDTLATTANKFESKPGWNAISPEIEKLKEMMQARAIESGRDTTDSDSDKADENKETTEEKTVFKNEGVPDDPTRIEAVTTPYRRITDVAISISLQEEKRGAVIAKIAAQAPNLDSPQRDILLMSFVEGLHSTQIAETLGIPVGSIPRIKREALKALGIQVKGFKVRASQKREQEEK